MLTSSRVPLALIALCLTTIFPTRGSELSTYPCHANKAGMGDGVTCRKLSLPKNLCSSCPLRPANKAGKFLKCWDIFDTSAPNCLPAMREYVAANPCDAKRGKAVADYAKNPKDGLARSVIDYFLYALCEQCCDCVPMGANSALYTSYLAGHSAAKPTLYAPTRGNCPAHAVYDVCLIAPRVTHFVNIGEAGDGRLGKMPMACPLLKTWLKSSAAHGWQENPKTVIVPALNEFFLNMLDRLQCAKKDIWDRCYALEAAQDHLGVPEDPPEVVNNTPSPSPSPSTGRRGRDDKDKIDVPGPIVKNGSAPNPDTVSDVGSTQSDTAGRVPEATQTVRESRTPCFPGSALVELANGTRITMTDLRIGDHIRVGHNRFSTVYLFSHRDPHFRSLHLRISLNSGIVLTLTPGHHLPVNGVIVAASTIVPGDILTGISGQHSVVSVARVAKLGLYNPHTITGTIVVDDIVCSTYTTAIAPSAAQALLAPIRALFQTGVVTESSAGHVLRHGADPLYLPRVLV